MKNKDINYLLLFAGIIMIISSAINYYLNDDFISLGIFAFSGLGFISLAFRNKNSETKRNNRYSALFFMIAVIIIIYWILVAKFNLF
jgi:uncharacterized membrane protein